MPVDHRIFKPAALSKAIASVFVCGALVGTCGQAWALEADDATFKLMRTGEFLVLAGRFGLRHGFVVSEVLALLRRGLAK